MAVEPEAARRKVRTEEAVAYSVEHLLVALPEFSALAYLWKDIDRDHAELRGGRKPVVCTYELWNSLRCYRLKRGNEGQV